MRFAYIDSQGNEVPIPSIDALALRIELGAVGPDTQLYDAHADHWGPAHTHEIFHSLSRDAEEDGFIAPPPPVAQASGEPAEVAAPAVPDEPEAEPEEEAAGGAADLGLTLAEAASPPPEEEAEAEEEDEAPALDLAESSELSLADEPEEILEPETSVLELETPSLADAEPSEAATPPEDEGGGFDFGDLGTGLEVEDSPDPNDMALETEMEFESPGAGFAGGGDEALQLEQPMSAFEPDSPPGWMEDSGPDDVMDFSAVAAEEDVEEPVAPVPEAPARQRRTPKDRPSPPKFKKQRSMSGPIALVVVALAIGVGGYYVWPIVQARLAEGPPSDATSVVMPNFPEELLPQMRSVGETAIAAAVADVSDAAGGSGAPADPDAEWLAGAYLGNASQYPDIPSFWESMQELAGALRGGDPQLYRDRYADAVAQAGVADDVGVQITERADAGLEAAQSQRLEVYGELERLSGAALDLHDFLVESEADIIVYRPGLSIDSAYSVDAVLGIAAPEGQLSRTLELLDEVTEALDALELLDRVTRDRLVEAMTARLQQVGIQ